MRNDVLQLVFAFLVLIVGAGGEALLPHVMGVGFPILLMAVLFLSARTELVPAILFAVSAGAVEDALSCLAPMTSVSYFLVLTAIVRRLGWVSPVAVCVFPCYQLWLSVWTGGFNAFAQILIAFPIGVVTASGVRWVLAETFERAAIDGRG